MATRKPYLTHEARAHMSDRERTLGVFDPRVAVTKIRLGHSELLERQTNTKSKHLVFVNGQGFVVIYKKKNKIITFWPYKGG